MAISYLVYVIHLYLFGHFILASFIIFHGFEVYQRTEERFVLLYLVYQGLRSGLCGGRLTMRLRSGLCCDMFTVGTEEWFVWWLVNHGTEEWFVLWHVYRWD